MTIDLGREVTLPSDGEDTGQRSAFFPPGNIGNRVSKHQCQTRWVSLLFARAVRTMVGKQSAASRLPRGKCNSSNQERPSKGWTHQDWINPLPTYCSSSFNFTGEAIYRNGVGTIKGMTSKAAPFTSVTHLQPPHLQPLTCILFCKELCTALQQAHIL